MGHRIWIILYAIWIAAVVLLSLDPSPPEIEIELLSWDKLQHAGAYGLMTVLGGLCWCRLIRLPSRCWLVSAGIAVSLGILLEAAQCLMQAGRFADWRDAAANTAGAVGALLLVVIARCRPANK